MAVFDRHVFVCTTGEWCPAVDGDGLGVHAALKAAVKARGLGGRIRINHAGCFSQCGNGPMAVVYPEGVWYAALTPDDAQEIVERHFVGGEPVARLLYDPVQPGSHKLERDAVGRPIGRTARWPASRPHDEA
jgi:(2Fe-2S) ferredoxin